MDESTTPYYQDIEFEMCFSLANFLLRLCLCFVPSTRRQDDSALQNALGVGHSGIDTGWDRTELNKLENIQKVSQYASACLGIAHCPMSMDNIEGNVNIKLIETVNHVSEMLQRIKQCCHAAIFTALLSKEIKGKDIEKYLPEDMLPLANILEVDWKQELEDIQVAEADLSVFSQGIVKYLSSHSLTAGSSKSWTTKTKLLDDVTKTCSDFQAVFAEKFAKAVDSQREITLGPIGRFIEKYVAVENCIETWQLTPVEWIFEDEHHGDVKKDIEDFNVAYQQCLEMAQVLKTFTDKVDTAECTVLKDVLKQCRDFAEQTNKQLTASKKLAIYMLFAHCALVSTDPAQVKSIDKYVKKTFGEGCGLGSLPEKLAANLEKLSKGTAPDAKIDKKDKKKKDKKDKDRVDKRPADEDKAPKEKKRKSK